LSKDIALKFSGVIPYIFSCLWNEIYALKLYRTNLVFIWSKKNTKNL